MAKSGKMGMYNNNNNLMGSMSKDLLIKGIF